MSVRISVKTVVVLAGAFCALQAQAQFQLQEATIDSIHKAIQSGETTCKQVIEGYVARARAYDGICALPVTADGAKIPKVPGAVRAGAAIKFPTESVALGKIVPDFAKYQGDPPDYGRMEPTVSDPSVYQQYNMVAGIPNAGQVNALEMLNIRGERSVTCKGKFDAPPGTLVSFAPSAVTGIEQMPLYALARAT